MSLEDQELCLAEVVEMLSKVEASLATLRATMDCECQCGQTKRDVLGCLEQVRVYLQDRTAELEEESSNSG